MSNSPTEPISDLNLTHEPSSFRPQGTSTPHPGPGVTVSLDGNETYETAGAPEKLVVQMADRRSNFELGTYAYREKERILKQALEEFRAGDEPVRRYLSDEEEHECREDLRLLGLALEGEPLLGSMPVDLALYCPSKYSYMRLAESLQKRADDFNFELRLRGQDAVSIPFWGIDGDIDTPWNVEFYTKYAVLFREEVENFLGLCKHLGETPFRPARRRPTREEREEARERRSADSQTSHRRDDEDMNSHRHGPSPTRNPFATTANATPIGRRATVRLPENVTSQPLDTRSDIRFLQENLANERAPAGNRVPRNEEAPHARFGQSRRLTELFEDPPYLDEEGAGNSYHLPWRDLSGNDATPAPAGRTPAGPQAAGRGGFDWRRATGGVPNQTGHQANVGVTPVQAANIAPGFRLGVPHFDMKLKIELIEEWDGDSESILDWFDSVNALATHSRIVFEQLGELVPTRFKGEAKKWWLSLPQSRRVQVMKNWSTLKMCISMYFMGRQWFDRLRMKARNCKYRDAEAPSETPSAYFIRKFKLLDTAENYTESMMIMAIMDGAPKFWRSIIDTMTLSDTADLQDKIHYHEDTLIQPPIEQNYNMRGLESRIRSIEATMRDTPTVRRFAARTAHASHSLPDIAEEGPAKDAVANLVGWSKDIGKPTYSRDDSVVSKGQTPEDKGARPCRHCGSPKHWDNECKHSRKGAKQVRANLVHVSSDYWEAQDAYEELYATSSSNENSDEEVPLN